MAKATSPASRKHPPSKSKAVVGADTSAAQRLAADDANLVVMGRIVGAFGIQGWVKVKAFTESPDGLGEFKTWLVDGREIALEDFEVHSKGPVAKLAGCDDREGADRLRGCDVAVTRAELGDADDGSLYWVDLVGLEVFDESGADLGRVETLFETGETSVLVVKGTKERMIPFVPAYVKSVDREANRITVDWKPDYDT